MPFCWTGFADEAAVSEFANSVNVGEPLSIPPVSLSPEESATVVSEQEGEHRDGGTMFMVAWARCLKLNLTGPHGPKRDGGGRRETIGQWVVS